MSDETRVEEREVLERQIANLREQVKEQAGLLDAMGAQLQLAIQMALRHDWTLDVMTNGCLQDKDAAGDGNGLVTVRIPVPEKGWAAVLIPVKQSKILTPRGARAAVPKNGDAKPSLSIVKE